MLRAASILRGLDLSLLAAAAGLSVEDAAAAAARLAATGLVSDATPQVPVVVADAVATLVPDSDAATWTERAAAAASDAGYDVRDIAGHLASAPTAGPATADCLLQAAASMIDGDVEQARTLTATAARTLTATAARGGCAAPGELAAVWALIGARTEAVAETVAAVDSMLCVDQDWREREVCRAAVRVAAAALGRRGSWQRAAELAEATGARDLHAVAIAAIARLAMGDAEDLEAALGRCDAARDPGVQAGAASALVRGLVISMGDEPAAAVPQVLDAARLYALSAHGAQAVLPEQPLALTGLIATHAWEFDVASDVLCDATSQRAVPDDRRMALLYAWVALRRGDWATAQQVLTSARTRDRRPEDTADGDDTGAGTGSDTVTALAISAGLARRRGDLDGMATAWSRARTVLLRRSPDLLTSQPVGELLIVGARLKDRGTVRAITNGVQQLFDRAGHPPLWTLSWQWDQLHVAVADGDREAATTAAKTAAGLPGLDGRARTVADAARCWADALGGDADPDRVRHTATALAAAGLPWEAGRMAGAAAIRLSDRMQMRELLGFARTLDAERTPALTGDTADLSPRERAVSGHLLAGLTHREIGAQLYIAPKTVEHHVARIRRKLGAGSRAEMLAALRRHRTTAEA